MFFGVLYIVFWKIEMINGLWRLISLVSFVVMVLNPPWRPFWYITTHKLSPIIKLFTYFPSVFGVNFAITFEYYIYVCVCARACMRICMCIYVYIYVYIVLWWKMFVSETFGLWWLTLPSKKFWALVFFKFQRKYFLCSVFSLL